ncbi:hypothetical protein ABZX38_21935 [Streptomyces longwoodensis]|uniref:hypothetical protein n=1 Tax=Streptomyces longwoodensis TaxID=68231 RepID=UPI0033BBC2BA
MHRRLWTHGTGTRNSRLPRARWAAPHAAEGDPWADAFPYSRGTIRLTLPELRAFFEEYVVLLNRYERPGADTPPGARTVLTRMIAFPAPVADDDRDDDRDDPAPRAAHTPHPPTTKRTGPR